MPDPKDNAKLTGDTHLPDIESDLPHRGGSDAVGQARHRSEEGRPGRGAREAGGGSDGGEHEIDADADADADAGDGGADAGDGGGDGWAGDGGGGDGGGGD